MTKRTPSQTSPVSNDIPLMPVPPTGRLDIHCHLLPGVDDGCEIYEQAFATIRRLETFGYTGSICTPHIYPSIYPDNQMPNIRKWVAQLQQKVQDAGFEYTFWAGGELRILESTIDWLKQNEMPTLAGSKCVLVDFWEKRWDKWIDATLDWMLEQGYQPILAHPERIEIPDLPKYIDPLRQRGVFLQGNTRCLTGQQGEQAKLYSHQFLAEGWYNMLALDLHRPNTLESRLEGIAVACEIIGKEAVDEMLIHMPRKLIFDR